MAMYVVTKTEKEIDDLMEMCWEAEEKGETKYRGMTYEQGIKSALCWVLDLGYDSHHPLED